MFKFQDRAVIGTTKKTAEGYLVATSRVARTGVQEYMADELGLPGGGRVRINRPESEVFHKDSLQSLSRVPVTLGHPVDPVTAENWKDLAIGEVGDNVARDGDWLVVQPMLKDAAAVASDWRGLSMGYTADLKDSPDGSDYDYDMVNIRHNHLALCALGRAGAEARIGDSAESWGAMPVKVKDKQMTVETKTVVLGDSAVEVVAKDADKVAAILKDHKSALDAKDNEIGALTTKLDDAEKKVLSDEAVAALVEAKVKANTERAAVKAKIGDKADKMSDAQIEGAFLALGDALTVDDSARLALLDKKPVEDANKQISDAISARFNKGAK